MARWIIMAIFIWSTASASALAAMEPEEVEKIKQAAPVHLQGEVVENMFVEQTYTTRQERVMSIKISEVYKGSRLIEPRKIISVYYTYIPGWVQMEGGAKMDIGISDRIEIWLEPEGDGWKPASSGDTVSHLFKSENRLEHIAPPKKPLFQTMLVYLAEVPILVFIALVLGLVLGLVTYLTGKYASYHS